MLVIGNSVYDEYSKVPIISKDDQSIFILDSNGRVKEYLSSDDKDFSDAYGPCFEYAFHSCSTKDKKEEYLLKQNEVCDDTKKWTAEEMQEILSKNNDDEEIIKFDITFAAFTKSKDECLICYVEHYNTTASDTTVSIEKAGY